MRVFARTFLILALSFGSPAIAQERFAIGPLYPGVSIDDAVRAAPQAGWEFSRFQPSGVVIGARASSAVRFAGRTWDVEIGDTLSWGRRNSLAYPFQMSFSRQLSDVRRSECLAQFSETVAALEPAVGPFGMHPGFADTRSELYGNPYGEPLRIENTGARSRMRNWPDPEWQPVYTFREPDETLPYVVEVEMEIMRPEKECVIKIEVFKNDAERERRGQIDARPSPPAAARLRPEQEPPAPSAGGVQLPASWTAAGVREARVNLARWRDAEHDRRRRDIEPDEVAPDAPLPSVSGYFAVIGDRRNPGGIVRGTWKLGWPFEADYVRSYSICGAQARPVDPDVDEIVYLGETALPEFDALDAALGDVSARTIVGRALPEGVAAPAWESPPGASDFGRHYPPRASANSIAGDATLNCLVQDDLSLRCAVASEEPAGYGFGQAALRVLRSARVVASLPDGQSSAGLCISRTVRFRF